MNIIAVDDEPLALASLLKQLEAVFPEHIVRGFSSPSEALNTMCETPVDIAFLDVEMSGMSGLQLGMHFKDVNPPINIIFVTAYSQYAFDAFKMRASGYLLKPATEEAIREEVNNLRVPMPSGQRVVVHTFGSFEVQVDGEEVHFARSKAKELFALLIHRQGEGIGSAAACRLLWPDKEYNFSLQRQFQTVVAEMYKGFARCNALNVLLRRRNFLAVCVENVDCDLYRMMHGDMWAFNRFCGKYMNGYSWASMDGLKLRGTGLQRAQGDAAENE